LSRGGYRWGRPRASVEQSHSLSSWGRFQWAQDLGYRDEDLKLKWSEEDGWLALDYRRDGRRYRERIRLTETPCHYGGSRFWFVCPSCGRRAGKVYLPTNVYYNGERVTRWLCRRCYGLTYEQRRSRRAPDLSRLYSERASRLLERHGLRVNRRGYFVRPAGMRRKTFDRLTAEHNRLVETANRLDGAAIGRDLGRLGLLLKGYF